MLHRDNILISLDIYIIANLGTYLAYKTHLMITYHLTEIA